MELSTFLKSMIEMKQTQVIEIGTNAFLWAIGECVKKGIIHPDVFVKAREKNLALPEEVRKNKTTIIME